MVLRSPEKFRSSNSTAFSLVEVLVVVAVIGIISAIAIPGIKSLSENGNEVRDQRNAQNLAQVSSALNNLGVDHVKAPADGGVKATAEALRTGIVVPKGPFKGEMFTVRSMNDGSIDGAARFLETANRSGTYWLVYTGPPE